jgi:hypothetical protein
MTFPLPSLLTVLERLSTPLRAVLLERLSALCPHESRYEELERLRRGVAIALENPSFVQDEGERANLFSAMIRAGGRLELAEVAATGLSDGTLAELLAEGIVAQGAGALWLSAAAWLGLPQRSWEDPRSLRVLVASADSDTRAALARTGAPAMTGTAALLGLEALTIRLRNPELLQRGLEAAAPAEQKLLAAVLELGGEVELEQLLDLEQDGMRLRTATGLVRTRRGASHTLERRGWLLPMGRSFVVPTEVREVLDATRLAELRARRQELATLAKTVDVAPDRAQFAQRGSERALAGLLWLHGKRWERIVSRLKRDRTQASISEALNQTENSEEIVEAALSPRYWAHASRAVLGRQVTADPDLRAALSVLMPLCVRIGCLSRRLPVSGIQGIPEGEALRLGDLDVALWSQWRLSQHVAEDLIALGPQERALRELTLASLISLAPDAWVEFHVTVDFVASQPGFAAIVHGVRVRQFSGQKAQAAEAAAREHVLGALRRMLLLDLSSLGVLDWGIGADENTRPLRLTARARRWLQSEATHAVSVSSEKARKAKAPRWESLARGTIKLCPDPNTPWQALLELGVLAAQAYLVPALEIVVYEEELEKAGALLGAEAVISRLLAVGALDPELHSALEDRLRARFGVRAEAAGWVLRFSSTGPWSVALAKASGVLLVGDDGCSFVLNEDWTQSRLEAWVRDHKGSLDLNTLSAEPLSGAGPFSIDGGRNGVKGVGSGQEMLDEAAL